MRAVNGFFCHNCADEELARRGVDPAHPTQAVAGNEVYVSAAEAARNRGPSTVEAVRQSERNAELGVNRPEASGDRGRKLNLYA